jgi:hypothetical protein
MIVVGMVRMMVWIEHLLGVSSGVVSDGLV